MKFALTSLALAGAVTAHTTFQFFQVNGVDYGADYIRIPPSNSPVENVLSADMACNVNGNIPKPLKATIPAGSTFTAEFHHGGRGTQGVDPSHKGPTIAYLAKVADATTASASGLSWFKIFQDGWNPATNVWAVDKFNANDGKWSFTIPTNIPNGDYLLRAETIALHGAGNYPGAQLYMGCAQISVTGASGGNPSPTVSFPGAYSGTDPGIKVNIYYPPLTEYIIPGPPVFGNGPPVSSVTTRSSTSTTRSSTSTSTSTSRSSSTSSTRTSSAPGPGQTLYGQCGGIGWGGATTCSQGTCTRQSDYYYQCLP